MDYYYYYINVLLRFKDVNIQILSCENLERCGLIKRPLLKNTLSIGAAVARTNMIFLASLLRDGYKLDFFKNKITIHIIFFEKIIKFV